MLRVAADVEAEDDEDVRCYAEVGEGGWVDVDKFGKEDAGVDGEAGENCRALLVI